MNIDFNTYSGPCIYSIQNQDTGKMYIGKTTNYKVRTQQHRNELTKGIHYNIHLQRSYKKTQNFAITPIELCKKEDLCTREVHWIAFFSCNIRNKGYNMTIGGEDLKGMTPELIKKRADKRRGNPGSLKGRSQSEAHKLARSIATKGISKPMSETTLTAVRKERKSRIGKFQKGKAVLVTDLNTNLRKKFDSLRAAERDLGIKFNTLADSFCRKKSNKITYKNYTIKR